MDIPSIPDYNSIRFSGCSQKFSKFYGPNRLYTPIVKYELELFPIIALFDFVWKYKIGDKEKIVIIRERAIGCPLQLLVIDEETDYESFTSLN